MAPLSRLTHVWVTRNIWVLLICFSSPTHNPKTPRMETRGKGRSKLYRSAIKSAASCPC